MSFAVGSQVSGRVSGRAALTVWHQISHAWLRRVRVGLVADCLTIAELVERFSEARCVRILLNSLAS
jgi:hypothetical protein